MQNTLPQPVPTKAQDSQHLADSLPNGSTNTPPSIGFAEFAKKVNQLADALKPQGNQFYQVGNYEIMGEIGHGGQGIVFHARDRVLNREVALKVPHLRFMGEPALSERFLREARSLALLNHPNIVRIHQGGEIQGLPYLVFDYCPDGNLTEWLKAHGPKLAPRTAAAWIGQLAQGLQQAHERNILHRDIKPNNIFLERQTSESTSDDRGWILKLGDFGLAKIVDATLSEQNITMQQDRLGTPAYMAPEQVEGQHERVCPATDVYSMGIMLYELLMGKPLYPLAKDLASRRMLPSGDPPSLRKEQPSIPRDLEAICRKCLEHDPAQRYRNGGELAADLRRFLEGETIPRPRRFWWSLQRLTKRYRSAIVALLCLTILGIGYVALGRQSVESPLVSQLTGLPLVKGRCNEVWAITFSPDGKLMYFAGDSGDKDSDRPVTEYVNVYDMEAHQTVNSFQTHSSMIKAMAVVDGGKTLITSSYDGTAEEWDAITGKQLTTSQPLIKLPFINKEGRTESRKINVMAVSRDEKWIAVAAKANDKIFSMIMVYNRKTKQQFLLPSATSCNANLLIFPEEDNNTYLLLVSNEDRKMLRWEFTKPSADPEWGFEDKMESIAFSPDGQRFAIATDNHRIKHYLSPRWRELPEHEGDHDEVRKMVFSADAQWMASIDVRGTVILWDLMHDTIKERKQYPLKRPVEALAFSPDGKWLAVGDCNGYVELIPVPGK
jgi:serine/threonine protein kinase